MPIVMPTSMISQETIKLHKPPHSMHRKLCFYNAYLTQILPSECTLIYFHPEGNPVDFQVLVNLKTLPKKVSIHIQRHSRTCMRGMIYIHRFKMEAFQSVMLEQASDDPRPVNPSFFLAESFVHCYNDSERPKKQFFRHGDETYEPVANVEGLRKWFGENLDVEKGWGSDDQEEWEREWGIDDESMERKGASWAVVDVADVLEWVKGLSRGDDS